MAAHRYGSRPPRSRSAGGQPRRLFCLLDVVRHRAVPRESAGSHFAGLPVPLDARPWRTRYPDGVLIPLERG
ncbi:MAG: hypothetical protein WBV74_06820, partial [Pseudonocardiaceae bacterium]